MSGSYKRAAVSIKILLCLLLSVMVWMNLPPSPIHVYASTVTDTIGTTTFSYGYLNYIQGFPITASASGTLQSVGVNAASGGGHLRLVIYSTYSSSKFSGLLWQSASTTCTAGWNDISSTGVSIVAGTTYYLAWQVDSVSCGFYFTNGGNRYYASFGYGSFPDPTAALGNDAYTWNMRITYSSGPPPSDFTITASPTSQSIGAGGTASSTLNLAAGGGFSGTVTLAITSGCPSGVTCTLSSTSISTYPNSATLTVPTLITTSGTFPVVVTATSGALSHTATFTVTVTTSPTYNFNVHTGATQVVVTVSWAGSGTASVTIAGPSASPTLSESGAVVYDRTTYQSGSSTPTNIHRVTFTLSSPPTGTWTAYVSQSGATVTIEVS